MLHAAPPQLLPPLTPTHPLSCFIPLPYNTAYAYSSFSKCFAAAVAATVLRHATCCQRLPHFAKFDLQLFCVAFPAARAQLASFACHSRCLDMLCALQRVTLNLPYHFGGMQHIPDRHRPSPPHPLQPISNTHTHSCAAGVVLVDFLISVLAWKQNFALVLRLILHGRTCRQLSIGAAPSHATPATSDAHTHTHTLPHLSHTLFH